MRTVAHIAIVLLFVSFIEAQKKTKQCTGSNGKVYKIGQGYETKCNKFICRWTKSGRRKPKMVKKSLRNCCRFQGKQYTIGEVVISERINKCSEKVMKCESWQNKGTLMLTTIREHCCIYEGKTLAPGEKIPLAQKCAFITCTINSKSTSLGVEVKHPGAFCCLGEDGSMFPQMAEVEMKVNVSEKLFSCCKGYWVHFPVTGNNPHQFCDAKFDPMALPDSPKKRTVFLSNPVEGRNWMQGVDGTKRLDELSIPGSHDTMAWKSYLGIDIFANCHDLTLSEQLNVGVRYLDLRLKNRNGWIGCYHDAIYLHNYFRYAMNDITNFLKENPSETVIFRYWNVGGENDEFCRRFNMVANWHDLWNKQVSTFHKFDNIDDMPTLDEVRGKIVVINEKSNDKCFGFKFPYHELDNYSPSVSINGRSFTQKKINFVKMETMEEDKQENNNYPKPTEEFISNQTRSMIQHFNKTVTDQNKNTEHDSVDLTGLPELEVIHQFKANQSSIIEHDKGESRFFFLGWILATVVTAAVATAVVNEVAVFQPTESYMRQLENFLDKVTNDDDYREKLMLTWASGTSIPLCGPKCVASHVNPRINSYLKKKSSGRVGIVVFDYITNWNSDLPKNVYSRNFKDSPPRYLEVSTNGEVATWQSSRLGKFKFQEQFRNSFPIWKKEGGSQYIFVDDNGYWGIGPDPNSNQIGVTNENRNPTPMLPVMNSGWKYWNDGFKSDYSLTVEAVIEGYYKCAVLYEHSNYRGRYFNLYAIKSNNMVGRMSNLVPLGWNDKISSIRMVKGSRYLQAYEHTNFAGSYRYFSEDAANMPQGTNDWISSLTCYR